MIQWMLAIWSLLPLPFEHPAWTSGSSCFRYCWSLAWRIFINTLLACEMSAIVREFEHSSALSFFGTGMKTDLFQSCSHCWVFQICWHIECSTFTAACFRIWNSSAGVAISMHNGLSQGTLHLAWMLECLCSAHRETPWHCLPVNSWKKEEINTPTPHRCPKAGQTRRYFTRLTAF